MRKIKNYIIIIATGAGSVIIFLFFPKPPQVDYTLYEDTVFTEQVVLVAVDSTIKRKHIFRNATFDSVGIKMLSAHSESNLIENIGFVFDNCKFLNYPLTAIRLRGSHKYVLIENSVFITDSIYEAKKHAISVTANVKPIKGTIDMRMGEVIIRGNTIDHYSETGTAIFGQKLSKIHITDNQFQIDGRVAAAIKFDDTEGFSEYDTDIIVKGNTFQIIKAYSTITFEQSEGSITDSIQVIENTFNWPVRNINTSAPGSVFTGNTFDYATRPAMKFWYDTMNRVYNSQSWVDNKFINCNCVMIEVNPGVDTTEFINNNTIASGVKLAFRNPGAKHTFYTIN